jgi:hypothetical protein
MSAVEDRKSRSLDGDASESADKMQKVSGDLLLQRSPLPLPHVKSQKIAI